MEPQTDPHPPPSAIEYGTLPPRRRQPVLAFLHHLAAIFTGLLTAFCALETVGGCWWVVSELSERPEFMPVEVVFAGGFLVAGLTFGFATVYLWNAGEVYSLTRAPRRARGPAKR